MALIHSPLFGLFITLCVYRVSLSLYQRSKKNLLLHPFVVSMLAVAALLWFFNISYQEYLQQTSVIQFLLGPATVALAWPMYQQMNKLGEIWLHLLAVALLSALLLSALCVVLAYLLGAPDIVLSSMVSKSITTPIALEVTKVTGGILSLTAGIVAITGVVGALFAPMILRLLKIEDDRIKGFVLGLVSHAIGTVRAFEISPKAGAFASIALSLMGIITVLIVPFVWLWLKTYLT